MKFQFQYWTALILIVGILLYVFLLRGQSRNEGEGFTSLGDLVNQFHYRLATPKEYEADTDPTDSAAKNRKEIRLPADLDISNINAAFTTAFGFAKDEDVSRFFSQGAADISAADRQCRNLVHPRNIGNRGTGAASAGCGWWYVEDPLTLSTGAYGTSAGPEDSQGLPTTHPGGRWIWDREEAARLESIKRCRNIRTCAAIEADGVKGECAFCTDSGHAVPINRDGTLAYPHEPYGSCASTTLYTQASKCPPTQYSLNVKDYKYDYDQYGNVTAGPNTDLMNQIAKDGGTTYTRGLCDRDAEGRISVACLKSLAKDFGFKDASPMFRLLDNPTGQTESDTSALKYLRSAGVSVPAALFVSGDRKLTATTAATFFSNVQSTARGEPSPKSDAAKWLMSGTPFDICQFQGNDKGPFPLECVQREFRKVGCQAAGEAYPKEALAPSFAGLKMSDIRTQFRDLFMKMTDNGIKRLEEQDNAVKSCLGIQMQRDPNTTWTKSPNMCREPGMEYFIFEYRKGSASTTGAPTTTTTTTTTTTANEIPVLIGYYIHEDNQYITSTTPTAATSQIVGRFMPLAKGQRRGYLARCVIEVGDSPESVVVDFAAEDAANAAANQSLRVNGRPAAIGAPVALALRQRNLIELQFTDTTNVFGTPRITMLSNIPARPLLNQAAWRPMYAMAVNEATGRFEDVNGMMSLAPAVPTTTGPEGRKAGAITAPISTTGVGYRFDTIGTVTCMIAWIPPTGQVTTLFRFDNGAPEGASEQCLKFQIDERGTPTVILNTAAGSYTVRATQTLTTTDTTNKWIHFAVVPSADAAQVRIYRDGVNITGQNATQAPVRDPKRIAFTRFVFGSQGVQCDCAWLHIYSRPLSAPQVGRDFRYDDPTVADDTVEMTAEVITPASLGFKTTYGKSVKPEVPIIATLNNVRLVSECAKQCASRGNACLAYGFDTRGSTTACNLYGFLDPDADLQTVTAADANQVSIGTKPHSIEPQMKFRGRPLRTQNRVISYTACADKCAAEGECGGFTYESKSGRCQLFRTILGREKNPLLGQTELVSGRMSYHTEVRNRAAIQGRCPAGMSQYNGGKMCCPSEPRELVGDDFTQCSGSVPGCSVDPNGWNPCNTSQPST